MKRDLLTIINCIRENKALPPVPHLTPELRLREDLELDSLDLAELTVRLEEEAGVDVFARGGVRTVGEIKQQLP